MKQFLFRLKFRFDLGYSLLGLLNLCLVAIAAGDKITSFLGIQTKTLLLLIVPGALLSVWFAGYLLDRIGYMQGYNREANDRNELLQELRDR